MQLTPNYEFKKIEMTDTPPDITVNQDNWDTADDILKEHKDDIDTLSNDHVLSQIELSNQASIFSTGIGKDASNVSQDYSSDVEGQSVVKLGGVTANNLIDNGDFSNTNGWSASGSTLAAVNNILTITGSASQPNVRAVRNSGRKYQSGNKFFVRFTARVTNSSCDALQLLLMDSSSGAIQKIYFNAKSCYVSMVYLIRCCQH
jgi:hypothetical protein